MGILSDVVGGIAEVFADAGEEAFAEAGGHAYEAAAAAVEHKNRGNARHPTSINERHKRLLRPAFGDLVDKVELTYDAWLMEGFKVLGQQIGASARGQTYGYKVYVKDKPDADFDSLLRLLAHELTHVRQFVDAGESLVRFGNRYFRAYFRAGFVYARNTMERDADEVAVCFMARHTAPFSLSQQWRAQPAWSKGWTDFAAFELGGAVHYVAHKTATGETAIDRVERNGAGIKTLWRSKPASGRTPARWTHLMSFAEAGQPYFLAYNTQSGDVAIHKIRGDGQGFDEVWRPQRPWTKGWTSFMAFTLGGKPHYLAYKVGSGDVAIDRIEGGGLGVRELWRPAPWSRGWTAFVPFRNRSDVLYLAYKAGDADAAIDRIKPDGSGVEELWRMPVRQRWSTGYTCVIPFDLREKNYVLMYSGPQRFGLPDAISGSGDVVIRHLDAAKSPRRVWCDTWTKGWTNFVPFQLSVDSISGRCPHYLAYKSHHGDAAIDRMSPK